jgi:hypothetical protein
MFSNSGSVTTRDSATEIFKKRIGVKIFVVINRGAVSALPDILASMTTAIIVSSGSAQPLIAAGTLRAFAMIYIQEIILLPKTMTIAETGFAGLIAIQILRRQKEEGIPDISSQFKELGGTHSLVVILDEYRSGDLSGSDFQIFRVIARSNYLRPTP